MLSFRMQIFSYIYFLCCIHLCSSTSCDINADKLVSKGKKLVGFQFWSAPTTNFMSCVKACVRVRLCTSVNYDLSTKFCDLNKVSSTNHPESVKNSADVLHSNIAGWPPKVSAIYKTISTLKIWIPVIPVLTLK